MITRVTAKLDELFSNLIEKMARSSSYDSHLEHMRNVFVSGAILERIKAGKERTYSVDEVRHALSPKWKINYSDTVLKQLEELNKKNAQLVRQILNLDEPHVKGELLTANEDIFWLYHIEDYKISCQIGYEEELLITVLNIEHCSNID